MRHLGADGVHLVHRFGKEVLSAGFLGELSQELGGFSLLPGALRQLVEQSDEVNAGVGLPGKFQHRVEPVAAVAVLPVGNDQYGLLFFLSLPNVLQGQVDSVIEGGAAPGIDVIQGVGEIVEVLGELLVQEDLVVEVDQEDFVFRIAGLGKGDGGLIDPVALAAHAAAVVDHQTQRNGDILDLEERDLLLNLVLVDFEIALLQPFYQLLLPVVDGDVEQPEIHVHLERIVVPGFPGLPLSHELGAQQKQHRRRKDSSKGRIHRIIPGGRSSRSWCGPTGNGALWVCSS